VDYRKSWFAVLKATFLRPSFSVQTRFCVNAVRTGNYDLPGIIQQFVSELFAGFRLLNLRNDALRRKYDSIKYDVTRLEEIMYDISVRHLASGSSQDEAAKPIKDS